jgi:Reverse transcriptase (RNA-dependent DNA polymerase)
LKRRERIILKMKAKYQRTEKKFGFIIPKTVREALTISQETNTTYLADAIKKEMKVIIPALNILEIVKEVPVGYQEIPCHIIFDVKMDFTRKARFVAGGHVTKPPTTQTYASVVSRDSVRIGFLYAALNGLDIMSADTQGAYLNVPCKEKVYACCGAKLGPEYKGKVALIIKDLYGLKTSDFAWQEHLYETFPISLEFSPCYEDADEWMQLATKTDGAE